ncbi:MAG: PAS domain S-box protein, partial [Methanomicrobiaceae archaeon]|nr:PAS domain S-box protein [Methanomicrobiaceae archaeon]
MTKNLDDDESESYKIRASGIIEHIPDPTFAIDTKGRVIAWNRAIEEMTGIPASDIIGKGNHEYSLPFYNRRQPTLINFFEIPEKKLREMGYKIIKRTDNAISIDSTEVQIKGKKYYVKANASRIYDESGNIAGAIESLTDITEKREAQTLIDNLLLEQEELLEIVNKSPAVAFLWKAEENWPVEKVSANISQFGYSVEDFISGRVIFSSIIHPDDLKQVAYEVEYNSSNNIDEFIQTYRILGKDKTEYWIEDFTHIRRNKKGIITHYQGIIINITERKKAEEALERSYAVLNGVIESPKDVVIFALDRQYCYAAFNENHRQTMKQIWGADIATGNSMLEYIKSPEDQKKAKINFDRALSGESFTVIEEYGDSALERRWYEDIYNPVTDENGNIIGLTLFLTDITKRKKMEEELKESEYRFRELFNSMHSGVVVYNAIDKGADFEIVNFNHGAEIIEKIKKQDVIGKRVSEAFPGVEEFGLLKVFQRVWRTGKPEHHPISLYQDEHIISWRENYVYRLPSGEIVAIYDDVTEARKAEEALAKEKNTIDFIIDSMPGMFYIISETSLFVRWNKNLETLTGYSAEELSKMGPQDLVDKKDLEVMFNAMKEAFTEGYAELEAFVVAKDGKKTQYLFSGHGRIIDDKPYLIGAALDLSRTKEAEKALIKEKNTTDYILESLPGMFYILDTKGRFVRWNKNSGMITGYSEDEISKMGPNDFIADKDKERVSDAVTNAFSEGYADVEADIVTKEGKKIPFFFSAFSRVIDDTPYLLGMALDITRTKEAEKEIAKLAAIVRHSGEFICLADTDGQITFINEAGA